MAKKRQVPEGRPHVAHLLLQPCPRGVQHQGTAQSNPTGFPASYLGIHGRHRGKHGFDAIRIGGTEDHVHALLVLPPTLALAKAVQTPKGCSSKHLNESIANRERFAWQEGYGAFSVSASQTPVVARYIENQAAHHAKCSFEEEFLALLKKNGVEYDPRYVLGRWVVPTGLGYYATETQR